MAIDAAFLGSLVSFINEEGRGVVATSAPDGRPEAALVGLVALDDGTLLFNTFVSSRKIANLSVRPKVAVVVGTAGALTLQLEGDASEVTDAERSSLEAEFERHAPGSRGIADGLTLVVVVPSWARFYDASGDHAEVTERRW
jgi:pyridoxine/pyridoxamine 5'-phosphate oxidase